MAVDEVLIAYGCALACSFLGIDMGNWKPEDDGEGVVVILFVVVVANDEQDPLDDVGNVSKNNLECVTCCYWSLVTSCHAARILSNQHHDEDRNHLPALKSEIDAWTY